MNSSLKESDTITELNVFNCIFSYRSQLQQNGQEVTFIHLNYQKISTLNDEQKFSMDETKRRF